MTLAIPSPDKLPACLTPRNLTQVASRISYRLTFFDDNDYNDLNDLNLWNGFVHE